MRCRAAVSMCAAAAALAACVSVCAAGEVKEPKVKKVVISGNSEFSRNQLLQNIKTRPSRIWKRREFSHATLARDVRVLTEFYKSQGFLDAAVKIDSVRVDTAKARAWVALKISEGPRTYVDSVVIGGTAALRVEEIRKQMKTQAGKPFLSRGIDSDIGLILEMLGKKGYLEARVMSNVRLAADRHGATIVFTVSDGWQITVGDVRIAGLEKTRPKALERELAFREGEVLTSTRIRKSTRQLYHSGLFAGASVKPRLLGAAGADSASGGRRDVLVGVQEAKYFKVEGGVGYGTVDRLRSSLETSYSNFGGMGRSAGFRARFSSIIRRGEVAVSDPWIVGLPLQFNTAVYYEKHTDPRTFEGIVRGLRVGAATRPYFNITHGLSFRLESISGTSDNDTRSFILSNTYDSRDNWFDPRTGTFAQVDGEVAGLGGRNTNHFIKIKGDLRRYFPIGPKSMVSSAVRGGWVREYAPSTEVPPLDRFYAGGSSTLRGFPDKWLGYNTASGDTSGGGLMLVLNFAEYRFPIYKFFGGALFLEAGNIWDSLEDMKQDFGLRWNAGAGLRISTPIGIVRLDFGFVLDRKSGEDIGTFHPSFGQPF
jgi:outer membrane protein insertion porin family